MDIFSFPDFQSVSIKSLAIGLACGIASLSAFRAWENRIPSDATSKAKISIIIIGASEGIGFMLARTHIELGDNVIIASRSSSKLEKALEKIRKSSVMKQDNQVFLSCVCDMTNSDQLDALFAFAKEHFPGGVIDAVVNNAGISHSQHKPLWEQPVDEVSSIIMTNLFGTLASIKSSIMHFLRVQQSMPMHIFNMCGAGTKGMKTPNFLAYGASKGGFLNIMNTMNVELEEAGLNKLIKVHTLSPGMVWTKLFDKQGGKVLKKPKNVWIFNNLVEETGVVAEWMAPVIRGIASKRPSKAYFPQYLTAKLALLNIFLGFFGRNKEKYVNSEGYAVNLNFE